MLSSLCITSVLTILLFSLPTYPFSCAFTAGSISYDLSPLTGLWDVRKLIPTPPTETEIIVHMDLCGEEGVHPRPDGPPNRDQCPRFTRLCLKVWNYKEPVQESDPRTDPPRITSVVPLWPVSLPDSNIWKSPMGQNGENGLRMWVEGQEWAGQHQHLNLTLKCDPSAPSDKSPELVSYNQGRLNIIWASAHACPRAGGGSTQPNPGGQNSGTDSRRPGLGFWGFVKFLFWIVIIAMIAYFALGMFYNHQQYSAKGWDLVPHRDFWREFPILISDLFRHVFSGIRGVGGGGGGGGSGGGGSSRGGYSSLG